ncbi:MAG: pyrimidine 5'-nucleotidase [Pseudomonadota bacterium]
MPHDRFSHVTEWVFDLDNTLYSREADVFGQMDSLIVGYLERELGLDTAAADRMRESYFRDHGATVAGLVRNHGIDPDPFLEEVHDLDLSVLTPDPDLAEAIRALPGRKIVFTNGTREHARRVTAARGLSGVFEALYGTEDAHYTPKPEAGAFDHVFGKARINGPRAAMFEDDPNNLRVPHARGLRTVLVDGDDSGPHIDFRTHDLTGFLTQLV